MSDAIVMAYRYGLLPPLDWDETCEREIRLQRSLWNTLVDIETAHRAAVEAELRRDPDYAAAADGIDGATAEIDRLDAERRECRRAARGRIETPDIDAAITGHIERRRSMWDAIKPLRRAARTAAAEAISGFADQRYAAFTAARQNSGLWWANSNAVIAAFDATLRRLEPGQMVRPAPLDDDNSGRLTVQIQRGCPAPAFLAHGRTEAWIEPGGDPTRPQHMILAATIRSAGPGTRQICRWPLLYHRQLPDGAVVKALTVARRRSRPGTGLRSWQWSASLSVEVPARNPPDSVACGIDLGWRKIEDGVRVATTVGEDDAIEHVVLPQRWLDARRAAAAAAGRLRVAARDLVLPPQASDADREKVRDLADRLQTLPKEARGAARDWLDAYKNAAGTIGRLERQRRDLYRVAAARLVRRYSMIGIDGSGLATIARDRSMPPEVRRMRTWTAPHELMQAISGAARREGVVLRQVSGSSTVVCHRCRHSNAVSAAQRLELVWRCAGCGALWDQDENAGRNCLAAVLDASAAAALSPPPAKQRYRPPRLTRKGDRSKNDAQTIVATAQI